MNARLSPIPRFGASDDPLSNTHLFYVGEGELSEEVCECLSECYEE
jgi:Uri superfamily endonuclease